MQLRKCSSIYAAPEMQLQMEHAKQGSAAGLWPSREMAPSQTAETKRAFPRHCRAEYLNGRAPGSNIERREIEFGGHSDERNAAERRESVPEGLSAVPGRPRGPSANAGGGCPSGLQAQPLRRPGRSSMREGEVPPGPRFGTRSAERYSIKGVAARRERKQGVRGEAWRGAADSPPAAASCSWGMEVLPSWYFTGGAGRGAGPGGETRRSGVAVSGEFREGGPGMGG